MDKLRRTLGGDDNSDEGLTKPNDSIFPSLSWSTRIQGFVICFILGFVLSIIGGACVALPKGLVLFGLFYTIGNLTSMGSTMFLMGPFRQIKNMFAKTRVLATLAVFLFMILTLVSGVYRKVGLVVLFCICQFLAFTWYSLSYIPFARDIAKKTLTSCI